MGVIDRTAFNLLFDDTGGNTDGTNWSKNQAKTVVMDPIDALLSEPGGGAYTSTGTQNDVNFDGGSVTACGAVRLNNASLLTITGIANGAKGRRLWLYAVGAGQVDINNLSGSSSAANQIANQVTGTISLAPGSGRVLLYHDGTNWRVFIHEQGAWISPAFASGDYTASAGNWTLTSGDVTVCAYMLRGRTLSVQLELGTTTVSATPSSLKRAIPGGFTCATRASQLVAVNDNGGGFILAEMQVTAAATTLGFFKLSGSWATSTDNTGLFGNFQIEVQ